MENSLQFAPILVWAILTIIVVYIVIRILRKR